MTTQEREFQEVLATADMYQLLAMCLRVPTQEISEGLLDGSLAKDVMGIFQELSVPENPTEEIRQQLYEITTSGLAKELLFTEMRREYSRLFTHPQKPAVGIYETTFLYCSEKSDEKPVLFISPAALDAERCYREAGIAKSKDVNESGDHMATEMEFMMCLNRQKALAMQENDREKLIKIDKEIGEFSNLHLKKWAEDFYDRCATVSQQAFYRVLGKIGRVAMGKML